MCKVKSWVIDQKKPVRFCHDWNDKEVNYKYDAIYYYLCFDFLENKIVIILHLLLYLVKLYFSQ